MTTILSQCFKCKYYNIYDIEKHSCKAFPKGIPDNVLYNEIEHDHKLPNQTDDYVYELKE